MGLRGSALVNAVESLTRSGIAKGSLWIRCGYKNKDAFQSELAKALCAREERRASLERITFEANCEPETPEARKLRLTAQRRLADGKELTTEEIETLPAFQRRALQKSDQPLPKGKPKKQRSNQGPARPQAETPKPMGRPPRKIGEDLLRTVLELACDQLAEVNIAIKCGYKSEEIGLFRRELARVIGCRIGPLDRLLLVARQAQ
jgi:hypothetical protein